MGGSARPQPPVRATFRWIAEDWPADAWIDGFQRTWDSYRRWFLMHGDAARPDAGTCRAALQRHMPELVPVLDHMVELAGQGEIVRRMLSLYCPTPYLIGCSQAIWTRGVPMLVRNYDYHPGAFEGVFLRSRWLGTGVLATSDCLWGALDGVNEHGLVVALAFGGRREVGEGFGIPLILRYVLETCDCVAAALAVLDRVPSHMSYNVSLLDARGDRAVMAVAPDRPAERLPQDVATNHQKSVEWPRYDRFTRSQEREDLLSRLLARKDVTADSLVARFLKPPLYNTQYDRAFGTLYTVAYRADGSTSYRWPSTRVEQSLHDFREEVQTLRLGESH